MEISQFKGFSELSGMEDPCLWPFISSNNQHHLMNMETAAFADNTLQLYANAPMFDHSSPTSRPSTQVKPSSWSSCISSDHSVMNQNPHYANVRNHSTLVNPKEEGAVSSNTSIGFTYDTAFQSSHVQFGSHGGRTKKMVTSSPQDHILAERKRREKLSQRFIALSALVPGLKKMDKASVLGDAIKYLKTLQERVKTLEEQSKRQSNIESVVFVKKYDVTSSDDSPVHEQLPEVEARYSGKDILIRVHCEKKPGVVEETLALIVKLHLSVINITVITFATHAIDITVVAKMDEKFTMTAKDLVKNLSTGLKRLM